MARLACLLLLLLALPGAHPRAQGNPPIVPVVPRIGEPFPDFSGKDLDGREVRLSDYKGKVLLIDFWATWCGPCLHELPNVLAVHKAHHDAGFDVVGISLDHDRRALEHFLKDEKTALPWRTIFDGGGWGAELAQRFGIQSIPSTFLLDREGRLVATGLRGPMLGSRVARMLDPNAPPPLEELLPKFAIADDAGAAALSGPIEASRALASPQEAALAISKALDSEDVRPARTEFLLAMLPPDDAEVDREDVAYADLRALALYRAGRPAEAAALQERVLSAIEKIIEAEFPERYRESQRRSTGYTLPCVKLALYLAKSGNAARARELLDKVDAVPNKRSAEFFASNQYYRHAKAILEADTKPAAQGAPT